MEAASVKLDEDQSGLNPVDAEFNIQKRDLVRIKTGSVDEHYSIGEKVKDDGSSSIFRCKNKETHLKFIAKIYNTSIIDENEMKSFMNEAQMLQDADHPNIIKVVDIYRYENTAAIVTEHCKGGNLLDRIQEENQLSENLVASYIKQIASALAYLHSRKIVHRDLRPDVCAFLSKDPDSCLKIVDFRYCKQFETNLRISERVGSPYYMAPDVVIGIYDSKCDMWSLGAIMYYLLSGRPPFIDKCEAGILRSVLYTEVTYDGKVWKKVSAGAKDLITKMLVKNPNERISARDLLKDPWIVRMSESKAPGPELVSSTLENISKFATESKLQKATLAFIVSQIIGSEKVGSLQEVFKKVDTNGDGLLNRKEILRALEGYTKFSDDEIREFIEKVDLDRNDKINYSEFLAATIDWEKEMSRRRLVKAFKALDSDHSGKISKDELMAAFGGSHLSSSHFEEMIAEADTNNDGEIDLEEFCNLMCKLKSNT
jgi:calcium-dependent protein kinase